MPKRFTETGKWKDPWYRKLSAEEKVLWQFLTDNCDSVGFWKKDLEMADFLCGFDIQTRLEGLNKGKERVRDTGDYLQIMGFIEFQYGELSPTCNPHKPIIALRESYKTKGLWKASVSLEEKEEEKEKETDRGSVRGKTFTPPSAAEVQSYCSERRNGIDPQGFVDFYASKGWKVGNQPMKDWQAAVRTWEKRNGYSPPKKSKCQDCGKEISGGYLCSTCISKPREPNKKLDAIKAQIAQKFK